MKNSPIRYLVVFAFVVLAGAFSSGSAHAGSATFTTATPIETPSSGAASSTIIVEGQLGRVTDIAVTLRGITHDYPRDFDILLVSPDGDASILMSDACEGGQIVSSSLTFSRFATETLPGSGNCGGFYRPADYGPPASDLWPNGASGPHAAGLDRVLGGRPNGAWKLYVIDDIFNPPFGGKLTGGWSLTITTGAPDALVPGGGTEGIASPNPLTRTVSGRGGVVSDVDVSLAGIYHSKPQDLDLLLVGPQGQKVMLMSDACGTSKLADANFTWSDESPVGMQATGCVGEGTFTPSDYIPGETVPTAPAGPYETSLSAFDGTVPDGEWRLYAHDDETGGSGFFAERFRLTITRRAGTPVSFADDAVEIAEGETGTLTLTRPSDKQEPGPGSVTVTSSPLTATSGSDFEPLSTTVEFAAGETTKTVSVRALADAVGESAETFSLTIGEGTGDAWPGTPSTAVVTVANRAGGELPNASADTLAPSITGLALTNRRFGVGRATTAVAARRKRVGTKFRYTLTERASVEVVIERRKGKRWTRVRTTLTRQGSAGANTLRFSGRVGRRKLRPGAYRAQFTATDAAGNRSRTATVRFTIVGKSP
jgi:subtilisin-like proprotein convertase family protein